MVGETSNILSLALNNQVLAFKQTARQISATQLRIATGKSVNSPLDNPQNFFQAFSLSSEASRLNGVLDKISQGITSLQTAETALTTLQDIITQAETTVQDARSTLQDNQTDIRSVILADNPVLYFQLNETSGTTATNQGSIGVATDGTFQGAVSLDAGVLHFGADSTSVSFNGTTDYISVPDHIQINTDVAGYPERTVELTFRADSVSGRQVLFKEGGTGNAFTLYIEDGDLYFVARDSGDFGPFNISASVEAGEVYHAAFVFDFPGTATFSGYLNGELVGTGTVTKEMNRHTGDISIAISSGGSYYQDGPQGGTNNYFDGRISDVAIYNSVLTQSDLQARYDIMQLEQAAFYEQEVANIFSQITPLVEDSVFQGINLLGGGDLRTLLNTDGSSSLLTQGQDLTSSGLGLQNPDFNNFGDFETALDDIDIANSAIENFGNSLAADLNILETRQSFTETTINTLEAGSDDLTLADLDEESANLLSLQTQQEIQLSTLALSSNTINIGDFLVQDPFAVSTAVTSLFS